MNIETDFDPCRGNPRPNDAGNIIAVHHPDIEYGPGKWRVVTVGDGTCDRDTVTHGLFWTEQDARVFVLAMQAKKGSMSDDAWLEKVSGEAAERIAAWQKLVPAQRTSTKGGNITSA